MDAAEVSLTTRDISIRFGGHVAVNQVSCQFRRNTLTAIVGPNGAGKTTYFNLISGQLKPSSGSVLLNGRDVTRMRTSDRAHAGIGRAFQLTNLFPYLTVLENVRLALQSRRRLGFDLLHVWSSHRDLVTRAEQVLEMVALTAKRDAHAATLSHGDQRKLEVGMLIALDPEIYMFDEPTAGMSIDEVPVIMDLIRALKKADDKTILLVEHKMDVVRELADRIVVLHNGALMADGEPEAVIASPIVQQAYLGLAPMEDAA
ncbi:MAG TPA: ABC transporter ATP-binding protein [Burkholderiaceae bacterium]|jgi:branched-chain amino acid transport system ATP-binding protein|nr:ABC transporter ATP-binding protein [Burkholderiaceae bacterium]